MSGTTAAVDRRHERVDPELLASRSQLVTALRAAAWHGFNEGIDNHFSVGAEGGGQMLLNRWGPDWSTVTEDDLLVVTPDGSVLAGAGHAHVTAVQIHSAVHRARPDAGAVFHTHMPWATALSLTVDGFFSDVSQNAMYFHDLVVRLPYGGLVTAGDEAGRIADAVGGGAEIVLLDNHGVLVLAPTVSLAWHRLYFFERACQVQTLAQLGGRELIHVGDEVARHTCAQWRIGEPGKANALFATLPALTGRPLPQSPGAGMLPG